MKLAIKSTGTESTVISIQRDAAYRRLSHWMPGSRRHWIIAATILLASCSHITKRGQSPEVESMEFRDGPADVQYIGDVSGPWGLEKLKVDGLALITELRGTGSDPPASSQRDYLIEEIKTHNVDNIAELLADEDNSIAHINGQIPPGAKKGDRFDISVQSMAKSQTTSLKGGYLMQARLKPMLATQRSVHFGHNSGLARGRVMVNSLFESGGDENNELSGTVFGGGVVTKDRRAGLRIVDQNKSVKTSRSIERAINARYSVRDRRGPTGVAKAKSDREIEVMIPDDYRHNVGRYFHVLLNIAYRESPEGRVNRLEWLERELHDTDRSSIAAVRLEAMGQEATAALKRGLRSDDPQVRFHAAEALAYMGDVAGVEQIQEAVANEPAFRWHGLMALAALRNKTSEAALVKLMDSESAEARYGAFRVIRKSITGSPFIGGELIGREYMLHEIPSAGSPIIHFSRTELQEIVLFGEKQRFNERLMFVQPGLTVKAIDGNRVQIQRYVPRRGEQTTSCSTHVVDVIRNLAELGYDYGEILALVKDAKRSRAIESRVVINAVPQLNRSYRNVDRSYSNRTELGNNSTDYSADGSDENNANDELLNATLDLAAEDPRQEKGFFDKIKPWRSP